MRAETYASDCCGSLFVPGFGPDNIVENDESTFYDAYREGSCPVCGEMGPDMMQVFVITDTLSDRSLNGDTINP